MMATQQRTVKQIEEQIRLSQQKQEHFKCADETCGWDGDEPMILDYDERGPHPACPVCKEEIPLN